MTTDAIEKLQDLLRELFQIESAADLDFGIYRIMRQKRPEVEAFIDKRLPEIVDAAMKSGAVARQVEQADELRQKAVQIRESFGDDAIDSQGELASFRETPLGKSSIWLFVKRLEIRRTGSN